MKLSVRTAVVSASALLLGIAPMVMAQGAPKESKSQRLAQLRDALKHSEDTMAIIETLKGGPERKQELDAARKARNAVQRLINQIEGRGEDAGIFSDNKRVSAERPDLAMDYYPALKTLKQDLELDYNILERDPGKQNDHRKNAMKFINDVHGPIVKELAEYERTHPAPAAPAAPATPAPAAPAAAPAMPAVSDQELADLSDIISHMDHSIDDVNSEPASDALRSQALAAVVKARDTVRQLLDELRKGDVAKDAADDHARDAQHSGKTPDYYNSMVQVQEYLHNDSVVLSREPDDAQHLRQAAIQAMADANAIVQKQLDAYRQAHPGTK